VSPHRERSVDARGVGLTVPTDTPTAPNLQAGRLGADGWGGKGAWAMGLGERCDEIVRLIDETLAAFGTDLAEAAADSPAPVATVTPLSYPAPPPARAAAGF
jgi:hypothetical protein